MSLESHKFNDQIRNELMKLLVNSIWTCNYLYNIYIAVKLLQRKAVGASSECRHFNSRGILRIITNPLPSPASRRSWKVLRHDGLQRIEPPSGAHSLVAPLCLWLIYRHGHVFLGNGGRGLAYHKVSHFWSNYYHACRCHAYNTSPSPQPFILFPANTHNFMLKHEFKKGNVIRLSYDFVTVDFNYTIVIQNVTGKGRFDLPCKLRCFWGKRRVWRRGWTGEIEAAAAACKSHVSLFFCILKKKSEQIMCEEIEGDYYIARGWVAGLLTRTATVVGRRFVFGHVPWTLKRCLPSSTTFGTRVGNTLLWSLNYTKNKKLMFELSSFRGSINSSTSFSLDNAFFVII